MKKIFLFISALLISTATLAEKYPVGYGDDKAIIEDMQGRYILAMDFLDAEAYAAGFAEDGVLDWAGGEVVGRQAIFEFMDSGFYNPARDATSVKDPNTGEEWPATSRHYITNQVIEIDGNKAHAISYWLQLNNNADRQAITWGMYGNYEDYLEKIDGEWFFTRRSIYNEGIPGRYQGGQPNPMGK